MTTNNDSLALRIARRAFTTLDPAELANSRDLLAEFLADPLTYLTDDPSATPDDFDDDDIDFALRMTADNSTLNRYALPRALRALADMLDSDDPSIDTDMLEPLIDEIADDDTPDPANALRDFIAALLDI